VFVNVNPQSTLLLGQARGAAICAAVAAGLPVREHTALQVKQAVVGYGKASKEQVQVMVQRLLGLPSCRRPMPPTHWPAPYATCTPSACLPPRAVAVDGLAQPALAHRLAPGAARLLG